MRTLLVSGLILILAGCAALNQGDALRISIAGMQPLEGEGMEARFAVQLRIQNHSNKPVDYDGIALDLDLRGMSFASGVSNHGTRNRPGDGDLTAGVPNNHERPSQHRDQGRLPSAGPPRRPRTCPWPPLRFYR